MPEAIRRATTAKSKIRSRVEHVFAEQKDRTGLFIPDHRDRESEDEDRTGEPRLQYQTPAVPAAHRGGMIDNCLRQGALNTSNTSRQTKSGAEANRTPCPQRHLFGLALVSDSLRR